MKLQDINQFFQHPPLTYLSPELAVCYDLSVLLQGEFYGTELMSALKFLESEKAIIGYWQKVIGRGRPRRMY